MNGALRAAKAVAVVFLGFVAFASLASILAGCPGDPNTPTADSHATACATRGDFVIAQHAHKCTVETERDLLALIRTDPDCRATFPDAGHVSCGAEAGVSDGGTSQ